MKHLQFVLVLAIAVNVWECGDAKFGPERGGELSARRRRCYDGSLPKRLKKRERKVLLDGGGGAGSTTTSASTGSGGEVCHRLYPRVSCCPTRRAAYQIAQRRDARVSFTVATLGGFLRPSSFCINVLFFPRVVVRLQCCTVNDYCTRGNVSKGFVYVTLASFYVTCRLARRLVVAIGNSSHSLAFPRGLPAKGKR